MWIYTLTHTRECLCRTDSPYQTGVQYKALPPNVTSYSGASKELIANTPTCMVRVCLSGSGFWILEALHKCNPKMQVHLQCV